MVRMVSYGANFVKIINDERGKQLVFKCKEGAVLSDRVIEEVKESAMEFVEYEDAACLYALHDMGWYLHSIEAI